MKKFGTVLLVIVILVGIAIGVYAVLPEFSKNIIRAVYQDHFDAEATAKIRIAQALENPNLKTDYKTILEAHTGTKGWVYDKAKDGSPEKVTFYGNKVGLIMKEIPNHDSMLYDNTTIKVEFITDANGNVTVNMYLGDFKNPVEDVVRPYAFEQLLNGIDE